jgi:uncharacterized protein (TIGR00369 family)
VEGFKTMTGLEMAQAVVKGDMPPPPIGSTLGYRLIEADKGRTVFEIDPGEHHNNPGGGMHGGVIATLLDSAASGAVQTILEAGETLATLDLTVKFLKPVTARTATLRCEGTIINQGKRIVLAESRLVDEDDRLYAHATSSVMIIRPSRHHVVEADPVPVPPGEQMQVRA